MIKTFLLMTGIIVLAIVYFSVQPARSLPKTAEVAITLTPAPASKLVMEDTLVGTGTLAQEGSVVKVNYTGRLTDGKQFDTSVGREPLEVVLGQKQVIPGFEEGILGMKVGGKRTITIPPEMAYGEEGRPPTIPGNSTLIFDLELLAVK